MTRSTLLKEASKLSKDERLELVQDLWDTIAAEPDDGNISDEQRQILEERLREHEANPQDVVPWEVARAEIRAALEQHRAKRGTSKAKGARSAAKSKGKR